MDQEKKDPEKKEFKPYISPRLRDKLGDGPVSSSDDDDDFNPKSSPVGMIIGGAIVLALIVGGVMMLHNNAVKLKQKEAAAVAQAAADSAKAAQAAADSLRQLAVADSIHQAFLKTPEGKRQAAKEAKAKAAAEAAAAAKAAPAKPAAGGAAAGGAAAGGAAAAETPPAPPPNPTLYGVELGSYLFEDKANTMLSAAATAGGVPGRVLPKDDGGTTTYQVVLGAFPTRKAAEAAAADLVGKGVVKDGAVVSFKEKK